jgi:hypothetical protein
MYSSGRRVRMETFPQRSALRTSAAQCVCPHFATLILMVIYCRYKFIVTEQIALPILKRTESEVILIMCR